ncbi:cytochrome C assembly family protein [Algicola sagamiensis]|uniref:cytochrome C assembly family protein n=1 Tax=Algicola sagamiensis TaxID=163869 RepID=UPI000363807F|nr:cytochrome c biogenesis protein CcsA [Algicola sagamiensis]
MMNELFVGLSIVAYATAAYTASSQLLSSNGPPIRSILGFAALALFCHAFALVQYTFPQGGTNFSLLNASAVICFMITLFVSLATLRINTIMLLPAVYGFSALLQSVYLFSPKHSVLLQLSTHPGVIMHIVLSFAAYCVLVITTLYAIQAQIINRRLRNKDLTIVTSHLPPLMVVEKQQFTLLVCGNVLLTLSFVSGFLFFENIFSREMAHKTVLSLIAWAVFMTIGWGHRFRGWRGEKTVIATIIGAILLTLAYFGSRFVREVILGRF